MLSLPLPSFSQHHSAKIPFKKNFFFLLYIIISETPTNAGSYLSETTFTLGRREAFSKRSREEEKKKEEAKNFFSPSFTSGDQRDDWQGLLQREWGHFTWAKRKALAVRPFEAVTCHLPIASCNYTIVQRRESLFFHNGIVVVSSVGTTRHRRQEPEKNSIFVSLTRSLCLVHTTHEPITSGQTKKPKPLTGPNDSDDINLDVKRTP